MHGFVDSTGNDGNAYLKVDGEAIGSIATLTQAAITDSYFGVDDLDAGHTAGVICFDDILVSGQDTSAVRVGYRNRRPWNPHIGTIASVAYSEHIFVGPGTVTEGTLVTANAGDILRLYDTDTGYTTGTYNLVAECAFSSLYPTITGPVTFERGCFAVLTPAGANGARAVIKIDLAPLAGLPAAACYAEDSVLKNYAMRRRRRPGNT
jgi:hypothetical protein